MSPQPVLAVSLPSTGTLAAALLAALLILAALVALMRAREDAFALLAMLALPFRLPISADGRTVNLLIPLYMVIAAGNDNLFRRLCEAVGRPQWLSDERFKSNALRVANRIPLNALLDELIATETEQYWTGKLTAVGVPCAPLQTTAEVVAHPQTAALGMLSPVCGGTMNLVGSPLRFDGVRPQIHRQAPALGADTDQALELIASRRRWEDL